MGFDLLVVSGSVYVTARERSARVVPDELLFIFFHWEYVIENLLSMLFFQKMYGNMGIIKRKE